MQPIRHSTRRGPAGLPASHLRGHVPMIGVVRGVGHRVDSVFAGHYSLLQTIEPNFRLPLPGNAGATVQGYCHARAGNA